MAAPTPADDGLVSLPLPAQHTAPANCVLFRVDDIFQDAIQIFDQTFTEEDKRTYSNFKNVLQMTDHIENESAQRPTFQKGPITRFCNGTNRLSASLQPYFTIISTFVQSDPRIAGLVWGSFLLIFRVCPTLVLQYNI